MPACHGKIGQNSIKEGRGHRASHIQVRGVIRDILNIDTETRKEKEKQCPKPRVLFATREEASGVSDWIIPECDCYYHIKAHEDHAL